MENELIYIPDNRQGWWGGKDERPRCVFDDKVAFETLEDARLSAEKATNRGTPMKAYKCKNAYIYHTSRIAK